MFLSPDGSLATLLGIAIGIERQWRSRMAGPQTIALVSMGSGLFTILGAYDFPTQVDRDRVAAQIGRRCGRYRQWVRYVACGCGAKRSWGVFSRRR